MSFIPPEQALGIVGGTVAVDVAVEKNKGAIQKIAHDVGGIEIEPSEEIKLLRSIDHNLNALLKLQNQSGTPTFDQPVTIGQVPIELRTLGHKHILVFVGAAQQVNLNVPGMGWWNNVALDPGWNLIDFDGAQIVNAVGGSFAAIIRISDESYGNPL